MQKINIGDLDEDKLPVEMDLLRTILADVNLTCFADIYKNMREIGNAVKSLIRQCSCSLELIKR